MRGWHTLQLCLDIVMCEFTGSLQGELFLSLQVGAHIKLPGDG